MEIKITKDMYEWLCDLIQSTNDDICTGFGVDDEFDDEDALCLFECFKRRLGIFIVNSEMQISICKSDTTEILDCIKHAYSWLEKNEESNYRLSGLADPEGLTLQILKWMGIECIDKEINEAIDGVVL